MVKDLAHVGAGLDDAIRRNALRAQISSCMFAQHKIDVADVVDDLPVEFLGNALVEAAFARLHMKYRYLSTFGRDGAEPRVRVAIDQNSVRVLDRKHIIEFREEVRNDLDGIGATDTEEMIGLSNAEIVK